MINLEQCLQTHGTLLLSLLAIFAIFIFCFFNPKILNSTKFNFLLYLLFPVVIIFFFFKNNGQSGSMIFFLVALLLGGTMMYFYSKIPQNTWFTTIFLSRILFGLCVVGGMSFFYKSFAFYFEQQTGLLAFLFHFLFFIPCLLIRLVEFLKEEFKMTPSIVYLLFMLELGFLFAYHYFPTLVTKATEMQGKKILVQPILLSKPTQLKIPNLPSNLQFAVSFWVYVNADMVTETTMANTNICQMSDYFSLSYQKTANGFGEYEFHCPLENSHVFFLKNQRWNFFVVNYTLQTIDLFVDGVLIHSVLKPPVINVTNPSNVITTGEKKMEGAICNLMLHDTFLTKIQISSSFNIHQHQNPPT